MQDEFGEPVHRRPARPFGAIASFGGEYPCGHHRVERIDQRQIRWRTGSFIWVDRSEKGHREPSRLVECEFDVAHSDRAQLIMRAASGRRSLHLRRYPMLDW